MDLRQSSPAVARNREPIAKVLDAVLPESGTVLEVASGSGEHAVYFAKRYPGLRWQPTDADEGARLSVEAWRQAEGIANLLPVRELDMLDRSTWPTEPVAAVFCANMIHISPWACTLGLLDLAAALVPPGGVLVTYGPYMVDGQHTAPSNAQFDQWLKNRDPEFGVRDMGVVTAEAEARGFRRTAKLAMPANNFTLVFERT